MRQINTLKNLAGRRLFLSADTPDQAKIGERIRMDRRHVGELLKGAEVQHWQKTEYKRYRDNMTIRFSISKLGLLKDNSGHDNTSTLFRILRDASMDGMEATDIAEAMLSKGIVWTRQRVLQELARHVKAGYVVKTKASGAINF